MRIYIRSQNKEILSENLNELNDYVREGHVVFNPNQHIRAKGQMLSGNPVADISLGIMTPPGIRRSYFTTYSGPIHPHVRVSARIPCYNENESRFILGHIRKVAREKSLLLRASTFYMGIGRNPLVFHYEEFVKEQN